jgi:hypothetical protein
MQTTRSNWRRAFRLAAILAFVVILVAGCSASNPLPIAGAGPLLTVESRGGNCVGGPCGTTVVIERDGSVRQAAKPPNALGRLPDADLAALNAAIQATDFAALLGHPFTGECPTAYDGQEYVFEFGAPGGSVRIATCEIAVDFGSPLFVAVSVAVGPFLPLPVS